ncbi:MAG: hypothetical protein KZQ89_15595 [Candidatus Thiodiazotropha sp. (ex Lucinoma kastoroae)]|nr:hypothetical protein [Candidatus Thiodiazotropha sp. (ex Lucinoma kastoroae)]MCU7858228.1 hypothetical protein [Candidatus Thiodiazotropha sp. (ex Lucinoma kastoroae)]
MTAKWSLHKRSRKTIPQIKAEIWQQDPLVAIQNPRIGLRTIKLNGESGLGPGPTTARVTVVDYNADNDVVYEPAQPRKDCTGFIVGQIQKLKNFKHHQVNVWALITRTLNSLEGERMFGRRIPWAFNGGRLLVLPHAGYWENAFYDRSTGGLHFFYFEDVKTGELIFTCLSHDIVTHELGHAVLDGLKPYYNEVTSPATAGFHEYFGDAIAMRSSLTMREVVVAAVGRNYKGLEDGNFISRIAAQFGEAVYGRADRSYLRSARNTKTMKDVNSVFEEHEYSQVMTGAFYDYLLKAYERFVPMTLEKAQANNPKKKMDGGVAVASLIKAAELTGRLFLRSLDYCPPVDINFSDYARAIVASDRVAYPIDSRGFRDDLFSVFKARCIVATKEDLEPQYDFKNSDLRSYDIEAVSASPTDAYEFVDANREVLNIPRDANFEIANIYRTRKVGPDDYRPPREIVIEFVWSVDVTLSGVEFGGLSGARLPLWCGGTLVFDQNGNLLHYCLKSETGERKKALTEYAAYLVRQGYISLDTGEDGLGATGRDANRVIGHIADGRLEMHRASAFRHSGRPEGR